MSQSSYREQADNYFRLAYSAQMAGRLDEAISLYRKSIALHPTAEAHTWLGWTYSFKEDLEAAIAECKRAVQLDPDFGKPYNDIGEYMMRQGQFEAAIMWLEQACRAVRFHDRHLAYFNLGRIYERFWEFPKAIGYYRRSAKADPQYTAAMQAAERLQGMMN